MHLQQKQEFGCGLYSVANALQVKEFATELRLAESEHGNRVGQLNKWLFEDDFIYAIETRFYDYLSANTLPTYVYDNIIEYRNILINGIDIAAFDDEVGIPLLLEVYYINNNASNPHMIACIIKHDNIILHDSINKRAKKFKAFNDLLQLYEIYAIHEFRNITNGQLLTLCNVQKNK